MGKKRIATKGSAEVDQGKVSRSLSRAIKKKHTSGVLHVQSTYNNTKLTLSDPKGNVIAWSSSGALGFKGAKKGTPFASSKVGDLVAEKASIIGMKDVVVVVKGVGAGRDSAVRSFITKGIGISEIKDVTPIPHNGPRKPKPRRV